MIQSVNRAFDILFTVWENGHKGMGLMEIARAVGLEKPTTYNLLKTLKAKGVLEQPENGGKYTLGQRLLNLSLGALSDAWLAEKVAPLCRELSEKIEESVSLAAERNGKLEVICRECFDHEITLAPIRIKPFYSTVTGRCLLAQMQEIEVEYIVREEGLPGEWWEGVNSKAKLKSELAAIRRKGEAILKSEKRHVGGFGIIVNAGARFQPLALGSAMPLFRFESKQDKVINLIREYAQKIEKTGRMNT